jgi:hypothetical protein
MKHCLVVFPFVLGLGCGLFAQAPAQPSTQPVSTTVCDIVKKPESFNGKIVRIKGTVVAGLDEFVIKDVADPNCGYEVNAIWLSYPAGSKGKAGPQAMLTIEPARNFAGKFTPVSRPAVTLDKSKDFKQFDSLLAQIHQKGQDMCLGCARYEVTATLTGRLDSVADARLKRDAAGKIVGFGGFGNMNAYPARLVLQSVSDVTPKEIDYSKTDEVTKGDAPQMQNGDLHGALAVAQKAANALAASSAKDEATKAADAYGKEGEHNGVNILSGVNNEARDDAQGTKDSPDGVLFDCMFNGDHLHGNAMARAVIHLGEHVSELRTPAAGREEVPALILESDGWVVTTMTAVATGQKFLTMPGGYMIWNSGWPAEQRQDKMESALKDFLANEAMLSR